MNWSSFNQWYPGTAVVSDPTIGATGGDALTDTGLSQYTMNNYSSTHAQNITWNGNFIDAVVKRHIANLTDIGNVDGTWGQIFAQAQTTGDLPAPPTTYSEGNYPGLFLSMPPNAYTYGVFGQTNIVPRHAFAFYNSVISSTLIARNNTPSPAFGYYMGRAYSILGNDWLSRQRSCMWRLVPRIGTYFGDGSAINGNYKNNSFTIEIQFDKPLLHISTPFADYNFKTNATGDTVKPYRYLTVNGQAMVRYSDKTRSNVYFGPG
jgi:hypothetical protein